MAGTFLTGSNERSTNLIIATIFVAFAADQVSKTLARDWLIPGFSVPIVAGFNLTLGFNEGASFGILSGVMSGRPLTMAALTGALTLLIAYFAMRARYPWERVGLSLIAGGSLGNITDRIGHGAVIDFIDIYWSGVHWPTFNVADIAIVIGVAMTAYGVWKGSNV